MAKTDSSVKTELKQTIIYNFNVTINDETNASNEKLTGKHNKQLVDVNIYGKLDDPSLQGRPVKFFTNKGKLYIAIGCRGISLEYFHYVYLDLIEELDLKPVPIKIIQSKKQKNISSTVFCEETSLGYIGQTLSGNLRVYDKDKYFLLDSIGYSNIPKSYKLKHELNNRTVVYYRTLDGYLEQHVIFKEYLEKTIKILKVYHDLYLTFKNNIEWS